MEKLQQFFADEQEVLADFLLDMEEAEDNKEYARAAALWSMQSARVGAIKDVLILFDQPLDEDSTQPIQNLKVCDKLSLPVHKRSLKSCCVCGIGKDLYSVTSESDEYLVDTYCGKHLPE